MFGLQVSFWYYFFTVYARDCDGVCVCVCVCVFVICRRVQHACTCIFGHNHVCVIICA